ncbi:MAG: 3-deoxy-manno-octulosonate cytidylyltransferase, partial [Spirochaetota bacterium]
MKAAGIIPARYHSTRLPGKPLVDIEGKPMIQHVYENCLKSSLLEQVIVATDDDRVKDAVQNFGGSVVLTSKKHPTGTDRVAEVAGTMNIEVAVNIQGDEPFVNPGMIDEAAQPLVEDSSLPMCTLMHQVSSEDDFHNTNVVKVVTDLHGFALYFSRSLIPYPRKKQGHRVYEHIGLYAYRKDFLMKFSRMEATPLEESESLEQLRALENGFRIKVVLTGQQYIPLSVDT